MASRIANTFARLKAEGRTGLVAYITVGYPTIASAAPLVRAAIAGGASIVELGIPFSDPLADGATHQRASAEALKNGATLRDCLDAARSVRAAQPDVPLVLMGYYNTMLSYGLERLAHDAAAAGVDGVIPVDLPPEEAGAFLKVARPAGLDLIFLLAPTSTNARMKAVAAVASGFVYCVSLAGVTGARTELPPHVAGFLARVRSHTDLPLAVGFGISRRDHVEAVGRMAEAAVVGSALTDVTSGAGPEGAPEAVRAFIAKLTGDG